MPSLAPRRRGRPFQKGNAGRSLGSRNRTTVVADALLRDEEIELVRKAIEMAKAGDAQMLKFLLDRILPKARSVLVNLPRMDHASDAVDALGAIIEAVATGQIAPNEAAALASLVAAYARTINVDGQHRKEAGGNSVYFRAGAEETLMDRGSRRRIWKLERPFLKQRDLFLRHWPNGKRAEYHWK